MKSRLLIFLALLGLTHGPAGAQENWPMFRGDAGLSGVAGQSLAPPLHVAWSKAVGSVESTAAILGPTVYSATMTGKVVALNLSDGKQRWMFSAKDSFSASPCVVNGTLYIGDEGGVFYALSASTGKLRFKFATGDKIVSSATPGAAGKILFGSWDGRLYCLDGRTGRQIWSFKTDAQVNATPCVVNGLVMISGCDGKVRVINLKTGVQRSSLLVGGNIGASPSSCGRCIYVGTLSGVYLGMRVPDGKPIWTMREHEDGAACYASAAATSGSVVFGSRSARVFLVDPTNGRPAWSCQADGEVDGSPVIAGGVVWAASDDGTLLAIDLKTGRNLWHFAAGGELKASPAIGQGRLVIGTSDGILYCLKP